MSLKPDGEYYSSRQIARARLNGQPTKVLHQARFRALWKVEAKERRKAYQEKMKEEITVSEARRAYAAGVRRETDELHAWLRRWGRILWS